MARKFLYVMAVLIALIIAFQITWNFYGLSLIHISEPTRPY